MRETRIKDTRRQRTKGMAILMLTFCLAVSGSTITGFGAQAGQKHTVDEGTKAQKQTITQKQDGQSKADNEKKQDGQSKTDNGNKQDTQNKTDDKNKQENPTDGETKDESVPPEDSSKIDISNYEVKLDCYMVMADGKVHNPAVTNVYYEGDKNENGEIIAGSEKKLTADNYEVEYFAVRGGNHEKIENLSDAGEYIVKATGKGEYEGAAQVYFTIVGKPQKITAAKTKYTLTVKSKALKLVPEADGDGSGFTYISGNPQAAEVSDDGIVRAKKAGRSTITILTTGNHLSHPAKIRVTIDVKPLKTYWTKKDAVSVTEVKTSEGKEDREGKEKDSKKAKVTVRWKNGGKSSETGVAAYEVMYGTSKEFKDGTYETKIVKNSDKTSLAASFTVKKGKIYYVRVRGLAETTNSRNFTITLKGKWSGVKKIEVK